MIDNICRIHPEAVDFGLFQDAANVKIAINIGIDLGSDRTFAALGMKVRCGPASPPQRICVKLATWASEVSRMIK